MCVCVCVCVGGVYVLCAGEMNTVFSSRFGILSTAFQNSFSYEMLCSALVHCILHIFLCKAL